MTQIGDTIILERDDLINRDIDNKSVFDFPLTRDQIKNARNILYIRSLGDMVILKVKKPKEFYLENQTIIRAEKSLIR